MLSEEADGLSDSAADQVRGVAEEDGAVVLAGATRRVPVHTFIAGPHAFIALLDLLGRGKK